MPSYTYNMSLLQRSRSSTGNALRHKNYCHTNAYNRMTAVRHSLYRRMPPRWRVFRDSQARRLPSLHLMMYACCQHTFTVLHGNGWNTINPSTATGHNDCVRVNELVNNNFHIALAELSSSPRQTTTFKRQRLCMEGRTHPYLHTHADMYC